MAGFLAGAVALSALAGCSSADDLVIQRAGGSVMMASAKEPNAFKLAIVSGTMTRTASGCLAISTQGVATPLVFPHESTIGSDGRSADIPEVGVVHLGDEVSHDGGTGSWETWSGVPDECRSGSAVAVWN